MSAGSTEAGGSDRGLFRRASATRAVRNGSAGSGAPKSRRGSVALIAGLAVLAALIVAAPASAATSVSLEPVTKVSYNYAHSEAILTTDEQCFCGFSFELSTDGGATWVVWGQSIIFGPAEEKPLPIDLTGLKGGITYKLRFQMNNVYASQEPVFTTLPVDPPENVSISAPTTIFSSKAELSGSVKRPANPDQAFDVECHYEYVTDAQFKATGYEAATVYPCVQNPVKEPSTAKTVTALVGCSHPAYQYYEPPCLEAATTYHVKLVAENSAPGKVTTENTFTTLPTVAKANVLTTNAATAVSYRTAKVSGSVERLAGADPALDVYCWFEYVTDAQFAEHGFENANRAACDQTPYDGYSVMHPITVAGPTPVTATINLRSGATYHVRINAEDGGGPANKDLPSTFTTLPGGEPKLTLEPAKTIAGYDTLEFFGSVEYGLGAEDEEIAYAFEIAEVGTENWSGCCGTFQVAPHGPNPQPLHYLNTGFRAGCCELRPAPDTEYKYRLVAYDYGGYETSPEPYPTIKTRVLEHPAVAMNPVTEVEATRAHFSGTVGTNAPPGPLDDLGKAAYTTKWEFQCTPECPGNSGTLGPEEGSKPLSLEALELHANTYYEAKLVATNEYWTSESPVQTFQTPVIAPTVTAAPGASDGQGGYFLEGVVDSNNTKVTSCKFEYGTTATYPNTYEAICLPSPSGPNEVQLVNVSATSGQFKLGFRGQTTADLPYNATPAEVQAALRALSKIGTNGVTVSGTAGAYKVTFSGGPLAGANVEPIKGSNGATPLAGGDGIGISTEKEGGTLHPVSVEAHLENLTPGATYHFRIVATSAGGTSTTTDRIFIPKLAEKQPTCPNEQQRIENSSGALPECRAYEMVSSPKKNGFSGTFENFSDGTGTTVRYRSGALDIDGSGGGTFGGSSYITNRTPNGWVTVPNRNGPSGSQQADPLNVTYASRLAISPDLKTELAIVSFVGGAIGHTPESLYLRYGDGHIAQASDSQVGINELSLLMIGASNDMLYSFYHGVYHSFGSLGPGIYEFYGLGENHDIRVDLNNAGEPVTNCSFGGGGRDVQRDQGESVSADGRVMVFVSRGCLPAPDFTPNFEKNQIWARVGFPGSQMSYELSSSECTRTVGDPGGACNAPADKRWEATTPDGLRIFFSTTQQLVNADTDETRDLYACDIPPTEVAPVGLGNPCPKLTLVTNAATGADLENIVRISSDGKTVYFLAKGVLADNEDALGETARAGLHNLYVWRQDEAHPNGQTTYVGSLDESDLNGYYGAAPQVTPSGDDLLFTTASRLVLTDNDTSRDVYRYDLKSNELTRISTGISGTGGNGEFEARIQGAGPHGTGAISDNGKIIAFITEEPLSPLDGNKAGDAYYWSEGAPEDEHVQGRVALISTGAARGGSERVAVDGSGDDIYVETPAPLALADADTLNDVYDARINGGFPNPVPTCSVSAEACQPPPRSAPTGMAPGSTQPTPGNPPPAKKTCPKGKVLKKGKCIKKATKKNKKHHKKSHKRANSTGGGSK
jgi:hypothetical protein